MVNIENCQSIRFRKKKPHNTTIVYVIDFNYQAIYVTKPQTASNIRRNEIIENIYKKKVEVKTAHFDPIYVYTKKSSASHPCRHAQRPLRVADIKLLYNYTFWFAQHIQVGTILLELISLFPKIKLNRSEILFFRACVCVCFVCLCVLNVKYTFVFKCVSGLSAQTIWQYYIYKRRRGCDICAKCSLSAII